MGIPGNKLQLSVVIIAKNAERCIPLCLESICRWAGEIIVVTNDCTDRTAEIAESYGARVVEHKWQGFKEQKNFANQLATMPWILSIDSDEVISETLKRSIMDFIAKDDLRYNGASCSRLTYFLGQSLHHGGLYPDVTVRLFRKDKAYWDGRSIHERLHLTGKSLQLDGDIYHYAFGSIREQVERLLIYSELFICDHKHEDVSSWKICCRVFGKFFRQYIWKMGFLDGFRGLYLALASSYFELYSYTRLYENHLLQDKNYLYHPTLSHESLKDIRPQLRVD